ADLIRLFSDKNGGARRNALRRQTDALLALDAQGDAHAAADAQRREAFFGVAFLHFVQQGHEHARAGGADRMTDRNRAAVDVDLGGIPAEVLVDRAGLGGERLVRLDQIEVVDLPAGLLERRAR